MYWILQKTLLRDPRYTALADALAAMQVPYYFAQTIPFGDWLEVDGLDLARCDVPLFPFGTYTLCKVLAQQARRPMVFIGEGLSQAQVRSHLGDELLNSDMQLLPLSEVVPPAAEFFIRPDQDSKAFPAAVMTAEAFEDFRTNILYLAAEGIESEVRPDTVCVVAMPKAILSEYRFFVVNEQLVAYSQYKSGDEPYFRATIDKPIMEYAQQMVQRYAPERAYVMDIAVRQDGIPKVLELNGIHACGLYAADVTGLVKAVLELGKAYL